MSDRRIYASSNAGIVQPV